MRVIARSAFDSDVAAQLERLVELDSVDGILGLLGDLSELIALLARYPEAGRELARDRERTLRKLRLRRAPFVAWYRYAPDLDEVSLYRLFHARQNMPPPRLAT